MRGVDGVASGGGVRGVPSSGGMRWPIRGDKGMIFLTGGKSGQHPSS